MQDTPLPGPGPKKPASVQVLKLLNHLQHLVASSPLKLPEPNLDQLKSLISEGAYSYLHVDVPDSCTATETDDVPQINTWKREVVTQHATIKVGFSSAQLLFTNSTLHVRKISAVDYGTQSDTLHDQLGMPGHHGKTIA